MNWFKQAFTRGGLYDDLAEEMRLHLEEKIERLVEGGMSRGEAEFQAKREFGNATLLEGRSREVWQWPAIEGALRDARHALRRLRKSPGFTATVLITLGLGMGASVAVYSLVDAVLLRPLQFGNEKRLVQVFEERPALGLAKDTSAPANYFDWKRRSHVFSDMAAAVGDIFTITGNGRPEEMEGTRITANLLPLLGIEPLLGRNFTTEEDRPGNSVALISAGLWQQRYGSDPHIVGKTIRLNGMAYRILGVMPLGFTFPERSDLWIPLALTTADQLQRDNHFLGVYGLLRPGVTVRTAQQEMTGISRQLQYEYPATNRGLSTSMTALREQLLGGSRLAIFVLAVGVGALLLIICTNVAGLMIARGANRQREIAVRMALGANRFTLLRQGVAESFILSVGGGLLGVLFAVAVIPVMRHFVPLAIAAWARPAMNWPVLVFTFSISAIVALIFGLAGQSSAATGIQATLGQGNRNSTDGKQRLRSALVIGEIALTTVILTSTGLLGEALWKLAHTDVGFEPDSVLTMRTELPVSEQTPYREFSARVSFYKRVLDRVEHLPGVAAAGYTTFLPFTNPGGTGTVLVAGAPPLPLGHINNVNMRTISPDYFQALGIPLLRGRTFTEADGEKKMPFAVINRKMARQYWPKGDAIGRQFRLDGPGMPWITVVGIVGDVRQSNMETPSRAEVYFSYEQELGIPGYFTPRDLAVKVAGDPATYAAEVEHAIWSIDPEQPIADVQSMRRLVDSRMETYNLEAKLFAFFSCISLLLSALGIYGLMSYSVTRRTREIGVRMALGARRKQILAGLIAAALRLLLIGLALGVAGSLAATRLLGGLLYGVAGGAWGAGVLPLLILAASVALAAYIPARRAASLNPMRALRAE